MLCKLCNGKTEKRFEAVIRGKYPTSYHVCLSCGFTCTDEPVWLEEAYENAINDSDTGILERNTALRPQVAAILNLFFDPKAQYLDFAGGYGIFTRLMRDAGFDFYWDDKYCTNLFAKGFEYRTNQRIEAVTAFEVLEHLPEPIVELEKMLEVSRNLILTTECLPDPVPAPQEWWYYGLEHGQHIAFYTRRSLEVIAERYGLHYYRFHQLHILTEKKLPVLKLKLAEKRRKEPFYIRKLRRFLLAVIRQYPITK